MRTLAIDYGSKRIGTALSDPLGITAQPYEVLDNNKQLPDNILAIIAEKDVTDIIVGLPMTLKGELGISAQDVLSFVDKLRALTDVPVATYDERLTTAQAQKILIDADVSRKKRKGVIDKMAAALMLQAYLDSGKRGSGEERKC